MSSVINLQDVSIEAVRGNADAGAAINTAIAALDDTRNLDKAGLARQGWDSSGTGAVYIPAQWEGKQVELDVQTVITRGARQNVIIYSDGPWGPRLINNTGQNYMVDFVQSSTGSVVVFKNLAFDGGSIRLVASMRGRVGAEDCMFQSSPAPAIHLVDDSVPNPPSTSTGAVGFIAERNYFVECNGCIWAESGTHVLSKIRDNRFLYSDGIPLVLGGPGYEVIDNDFQLVEATAGTGVGGAFIWLKGGFDQLDPAQHAISLTSIDKNRFGSESGATYNSKSYYPPHAAVLLGEPGTPRSLTDPATNISGTATVNFDDNQFLGVAASLNGSTPAGHAEYGIYFANRPVDCVVGPRAVIRNYRTAFIGGNYQAAVAPQGPYVEQRDRNMFLVGMEGFDIANPAGGSNPVFDTGHSQEWRIPFVYAGGLTLTGPGPDWDHNYFTLNTNQVPAYTDVGGP